MGVGGGGGDPPPPEAKSVCSKVRTFQKAYVLCPPPPEAQNLGFARPPMSTVHKSNYGYNDQTAIPVKILCPKVISISIVHCNTKKRPLSVVAAAPPSSFIECTYNLDMYLLHLSIYQIDLPLTQACHA